MAVVEKKGVGSCVHKQINEPRPGAPALMRMKPVARLSHAEHAWYGGPWLLGATESNLCHGRARGCLQSSVPAMCTWQAVALYPSDGSNADLSVEGRHGSCSEPASCSGCCSHCAAWEWSPWTGSEAEHEAQGPNESYSTPDCVSVHLCQCSLRTLTVSSSAPPTPRGRYKLYIKMLSTVKMRWFCTCPEMEPLDAWRILR